MWKNFTQNKGQTGERVKKQDHVDNMILYLIIIYNHQFSYSSSKSNSS